MPEKLIAKMSVEKLFGLYTYELPPDGVFSDAAILYGDNGVGKSTLLKLAFHLLSAANNKGHRGSLYATEFEKLKVELASGVVVTAAMSNRENQRLLTLEIWEGGKRLVVWDWHPNHTRHDLLQQEIFGSYFLKENLIQIPSTSKSNRKKRKVLHGNEAYIEHLEMVAPAIFILDADRRLGSDLVSDPDDEVELRRLMRYEEPRGINELISRSREIALSQAMSAAGRWIAKKAVHGTNQGSMNVHSAYVDIIRHITSSTSSESLMSDMAETENLIEKLDSIERSTNSLAEYELATRLSTSEFKQVLRDGDQNKRRLAGELLKPYVKSLEGRLQAVDSIYQVVDRFVKTVNGFLGDKKLSFNLSQGFTIKNKLGKPLNANQLSSGEQQLLLLFCYVLTARDKPSVFMIDEPEISLNVKWQRNLINSLLEITNEARIQFIFASHSIELLAQHSDKVIKLVSAHD